MKLLKIWIQAARPKTLIASISPVLIASAMALKAGSFDFALFVILLLCNMGIQISCNIANDYFDFLKGADRPERLGPMRVMQAGLVNIGTMQRMILFSMAVTACLGIYIVVKGGLFFALLLAVALSLALLYTAGPFSLAYLGLGDLFVLLFFGPVSTCATFYLFCKALPAYVILASLAPGLLSTAILICNNLRDEAEDHKSRKKTLIVRFGNRFGKMEFALCVSLALLLPMLLLRGHSMVSLMCLLWPAGYLLIRQVIKNSSAVTYNLYLQQSAQLLWVYTFLFAFSWMI